MHVRDSAWPSHGEVESGGGVVVQPPHPICSRTDDSVCVSGIIAIALAFATILYCKILAVYRIVVLDYSAEYE